MTSTLVEAKRVPALDASGNGDQLDARPPPAQVLIEEARRRQRRRWAFSALALVAVIGLVAGLVDALSGSPPPTRVHHGPTVASPGEVAAFLARAAKGFSGEVVLRYAVQYGAGAHAHSGSVLVAQVSKTKWAYISNPPVTDLHAAEASSSVLDNPIRVRAGRYHCLHQAASSLWTCANFSTALMGTNAMYLGPYPPTALIRGLQSAILDYSGKSPGERRYVREEPAHLVVRRVDSRESSCLVFGKPATPVALVCLDADNLIASYDIPTAVTGGGYTKAQLRTHSRSVPDTLLTLPAKPTAALGSERLNVAQDRFITTPTDRLSTPTGVGTKWRS